MTGIGEQHGAVKEPRRLRAGSNEIVLDHPIVIGIINVTPDSFTDGGNFFSPANAVAHARRLVADGADALEIGGESTRPGATAVEPEEEIRRVVPVVVAVRERWPDLPISVDTNKAEVAAAALRVGATMVNDVSALRLDPMMGRVVRWSDCAVILMHSRGDVSEMASYDHADYGDDPVATIIGELASRAKYAESIGVARERIVLDPGLGFSKRTEHSRAVLLGLDVLAECGYPVMVGTSRKRFVKEGMAEGLAAMKGAGEPVDPAEFSIAERDAGTVGASIVALTRGAMLFRVHDVRAHRRALDVAWSIIKSDHS
ncbi:MAG TPA: dihydropteroate synthase [Gemmatimonadaceae bacterium]|nr:dihydropteroate synthase [Gemmatimonadaceae bacterium]